MEQIKSESAARQEQVKSEYDEAVELENSKYEIAKEGFENRLSALDTFIEDETARLEAARDKKIADMESETNAYLAELQKRIDKEKELKEAAEKRLEAEKKAESKTDYKYGIFSGEFTERLRKKKKEQGGLSLWEAAWYNFVVGHNASGTNNWRGGLTYVHEQGGELINLPQHTQIVPHDLSVEYMRELARVKAGTQNTYNQYGAQQQVNVFSVDGKTVTEVIEPRVSVMMSDNIYRRRRSGGK